MKSSKSSHNVLACNVNHVTMLSNQLIFWLGCATMGIPGVWGAMGVLPTLDCKTCLWGDVFKVSAGLFGVCKNPVKPKNFTPLEKLV